MASREPTWREWDDQGCEPSSSLRLQARPLTSPHLTSPQLSSPHHHSPPHHLRPSRGRGRPRRRRGLEASLTGTRPLPNHGPSHYSHQLAPRPRGSVRPCRPCTRVPRLPPPRPPSECHLCNSRRKRLLARSYWFILGGGPLMDSGVAQWLRRERGRAEGTDLEGPNPVSSHLPPTRPAGF